jgi:AraC family transcriptional regulator
MQQTTSLTLGRVVRRASGGGFEVLETTYPAHHPQPFHEHDLPVFVYVLDGGVSVTCSGTDFDCPPGSLRIVPAGQRHRTSYGAGRTRCLIVGVGEERAASLRRASPILDRPAYHPPGSPAVASAGRIEAELDRNDTVTPLAVEALLLELVVADSRWTRGQPDRRTPPWLEQVRAQLHAGFRGSFQFARLAAEAQVHPGHLSRAFRRHFGCTIAAYLRRLRLDWAKAELLERDRTIGRIAVEAGFADQGDFSRRFRREMGMTPSQFRGTRATR